MELHAAFKDIGSSQRKQSPNGRDEKFPFVSGGEKNVQRPNLSCQIIEIESLVHLYPWSQESIRNSIVDIIV